MTLFVYCIIFFHWINIKFYQGKSPKINKQQNKYYQLKYQLKSNQNIDFSGYEGFLPNKLPMINFNEIGNVINNILKSKGISVENLEIIDYNSHLLVILTFPSNNNPIYKIVLEKPMEDLLKPIKEQNKNLNFNMFSSPLPINEINQQSVIKIIELLLSKSGSIFYDIQTHIANNTLYIKNINKNLLPKTIYQLNFCFISSYKGTVDYNWKIPKDLELSKIKQCLVLEENNVILQVLQALKILSNIPPIQLIERDDSKLQSYIKSQGYRDGQLLDIKYIEDVNGFQAYVYIYIGEKLPIYNVTFSFDKKNNDGLLLLLTEKYKKIINDKKLLEEEYIPNIINKIIYKFIKTPLKISKTINFITHPYPGYNINFHIKDIYDPPIIENIYFINNNKKNLYKLINSTIGSEFSIDTLNEDKLLLEKKLEEKIEYTLNDGKNPNGKIILFTVGEPFNINNILSSLKPNISFNLDGLKINQSFKHKFSIKEADIPINFDIYIEKDKKKNCYILKSNNKIQLMPLLFEIFEKKFNKNYGFNIIFGGDYQWKLPIALNNFSEFFFGLGGGLYHIYKKKNFLNHNFNVLYSKYSQSKLTKLSFLEELNDYNQQEGFNYKYNFSINTKEIFSINDNFNLELLFRDKIDFINWKNLFFVNLRFLGSVNYNFEFLQSFFIQISSQILYGQNKSKHYFSDMNLMGNALEITSSDINQFQKGILVFTSILKQIQSIDTVLGKKLIIFMGLFFNGIYSDKYYKDLISFSGLIFSFKVDNFILNIYIPLLMTHNKSESNTAYIFKKRMIDFSFESNKLINNQSLFFMYKPKINLNDNIIGGLYD